MVARTKIVRGKYILVIRGPELTRDPAENDRELAKRFQGRRATKRKRE